MTFNLELIAIFSGVLTLVFSFFLYMLYKKMNQQKSEKELALENAKELYEKIIHLEYQLEEKTPTALTHIKKIEELEDLLDNEKKKVQNTLKVAQEANRIKSEFLSNVRHEIRTPMNSIMAFANLLVAETSEETLRNYSHNILMASQELLELLDDIIEFSSVEKGLFEFNKVPTDIEESVLKIIHNVEKDTAKKSVTVRFQKSDNFPQTLVVDKEKFEEIIYNLIKNAVVFTPEGEVVVSLKATKHNIVENSIDLALEVQDCGVGIATKDLERIFELFEKPNSNDGFQRGAGITLAMHKKMAKAMGGDLLASSSKGKGSLFTLQLNNVEILLPSKDSDDFEQSSVDFSLLRAVNNFCIVIDEHIKTVEFIKSAFDESNIRIESFSGMRDAVKLLQSKSVDVVFIDTEILTADENVVCKMLMKMTKASIVTLNYSDRLKKLQLPKNAPVALHLKMPTSKAELFDATLKAIDYHSSVSSLHLHQEIQNSEKEKNIHYENRRLFLQCSQEKVQKNYMEALHTNDLKSIEVFAKLLQKCADEYGIETFSQFAKTLLQKVKEFEIDAIQSMMQQYQEMISLLKKENL